MTIEVKIYKILGLRIINKGSVLEWKWCGVPEKTVNFYGNIASSFANKVVSTSVDPTIVQAIKEADETECLTSKSEYIRECKKWFINSK